MAVKSRSRRPTITDVAGKLGISAMTVSRALNGKPDISERTRKAVMRCAEAIGYRPNRWARSLVTQRSNLIGVVLPEIAHSFFADLIAGVEEVVDPAGYDLLLCHSRGNAEREADEVKTLVGNRIDGLIVASVEPVTKAAAYLDLQRRRIPFVLVDRFFPGHAFSFVGLDDRAAGRLATEFLIGLGHQRIAHLAGPASSNGKLRKEGYVAAMRAAGLDAGADWILRAPFDIEEGRLGTHKILDRQLAPTAIFAANDPLAIGAIYACRERGLDVPGDISIMGAGNIEGLFHPNPFLSTVDWPRLELGRIGARFLLEMIASTAKKPEQPVHLFQPEILPRHSTRRIL